MVSFGTLRTVETEGHELITSCAQGALSRCQAILDRKVVTASYQDEATGRSALMAAAGAPSLECVQLLLERGAPWNALDRSGRCAGEYAMAAGSQACVDALVNAGVQAQLLFGLLGDTTTTDDRSTAAYLDARVEFLSRDQTLVDSAGDAVMMEWERPLMEASADVLCGGFAHEWCRRNSDGDLSILNIGHGLGIIDGYIRDKRPARHVIVEAHPQVLDNMRDIGWFERADVRAETWQSALDDLTLGTFDGVYYDTYAEKWSDMQAFFQALPRILKRGGLCSFFNGCCPFNPFFHGVSCQFIALELGKLGFEIDFVPLKVEHLPEATWKGIRRRYWTFDSYHLPIIRWKE